jgi:hypothetical protein
MGDVVAGMVVTDELKRGGNGLNQVVLLNNGHGQFAPSVDPASSDLSGQSVDKNHEFNAFAMLERGAAQACWMHPRRRLGAPRAFASDQKTRENTLLADPFGGGESQFRALK